MILYFYPLSGYGSGGRALASGARGRAFESRYPDQYNAWLLEETLSKNRFFTKFAKWLACSFLYKVEFKNTEVLDKYDSYIIAPSHSNVFDSIFVFPQKYEKDVSIAAKKELFNNFIFRRLAKTYNVFPVDRENIDISSIRKPLDIFKSSETAKLIVFPEGRIIKNEDEVGQVYKKGVAFIAFHAKRPIIPVFITRRPKFFSKVTVSYGEPFVLDDKEYKGKTRYDEASMFIMNKIYQLRENDQKLIGGQQWKR